MNSYQTALARFLDKDGIRQDDIAAKVKVSQAAINRYAKGRRFPNAKTAKLIETATDGEVPFELWQQAAIERYGIAVAA